MTIMVAGGMTFAAPGMIPAAHAANANLFVSAENSQFNNYFGGPMVIEIVVNDPDVKDTDDSKGEPDVTVNGKIVRMLQGSDGLWYAYFADRSQAQLADATAIEANGYGLDFGDLCNRHTVIDTVTFSDTVGIAVNGDVGNINNHGVVDVCNSDINKPVDVIQIGINKDVSLNNVVREAKNLSINNAGLIGQLGTDNQKDGYALQDAWPIVQLYDLNPTGNVVVQYNKGGNPQTVTLTFDTLDGYLDASLDREFYPRGAAFHATLTDQALNIDPTDEDSWTFNTVDTLPATYYQFFDESGNNAGGCGIDDNGDLAVCVVSSAKNSVTPDVSGSLADFFFEDGGVLLLDTNAQNAKDNSGNPLPVIEFQDNDDQFFAAFDSTPGTIGIKLGLEGFKQPVTLVELGPNSGVFANYDEGDKSNIIVTSDAKRGTSATLTWDDTGHTALVDFDYAHIDIQPVDDEWSSGEAIPVVLTDADANLNSRFDEDLDLNNPRVDIIPSILVGSPITLETLTDATLSTDGDTLELFIEGTDEVQVNSQRALLANNASGNSLFNTGDILTLTLGTTIADLGTVWATNEEQGVETIINSFNYDIRSVFGSGISDDAAGSPNAFKIGINDVLLVANDGSKTTFSDLSGDFVVNPDTIDAILANNDDDYIVIKFIIEQVSGDAFIEDGTTLPIVVDFFSFGYIDDGAQSGERITNELIRLELEETGDNTGEFVGEIEFIMLNQLNISDASTYDGLGTIGDNPTMIVYEDFTDEDSVRVVYNDLAADGTRLPVADQEEAPSHSGTVDLDLDTYKVADTVEVTLEDLDLNVDSDLREIYTVVSNETDPAYDNIGVAGLPNFTFGPQGALLNITFDDVLWQTPVNGGAACENNAKVSLQDTALGDTGLGATGFTLVETGIDSGIFVGDFAVPATWCRNGTGTLAEPAASETTTGLDIEVNYIDYRDASGEIIEVGDGAGIRANTGSVSLDRTVYPVPFGTTADFDSDDSSPNGRSLFPVHATGIAGDIGDGEFLDAGDLTVHVRINDPDFDVSPEGEDVISQAIDGKTKTGPLKVSVIRSSNTVILGYAGGPTADAGKLFVGDSPANTDDVRQLGPISETAPDSGIFELDLNVRFTDGPADSRCPDGTMYEDVKNSNNKLPNEPGVRFTGNVSRADNYCILQGDILHVEYTDPTDASGDKNTVTDSATFDLRNGVLQTDKSVYIIGGDMILTLIEPDLDLENDAAETYDLDLIEWDSDAATITMGNIGKGSFDPEPTAFRETGDSTGIFQIVIEIPEELDNDILERGEEIVLEYTDWGPSGSEYVGDEDEDVNVTVYTSNFGATIELDQKVYTWTDKVYITIVAPDHNFDGGLVDEIGESERDPIKISTRGHDIDNYKLVETGTDTGIFTGEIILIGFEHDADGDVSTGEGKTGFDKGSQITSKNQSGPTDGFLETDDDDGITVSFEFSEDETVVGSALIRWNIGEVQWLEASYPASGTGVVRVIDPDMNLDPEAVDNFDVDVWSDSDAGGIDLTVTETNEATGIFEGTVFFTITNESSGHRLRVAEGDTVTAEYEDNTLPDPYTTADELDITATSLIGTIKPPLERAPAANLRIVDAFDNSLDTVSVDQQVQISADLVNGQDKEQSFAYLVQVQDNNGVTVSLAWITGNLGSGQSLSPALSWIPTEAGTYTATAFVWESVNNPTALSPPVSTTVTVN
jgi:hypothetical protein